MSLNSCLNIKFRESALMVREQSCLRGRKLTVGVRGLHPVISGGAERTVTLLTHVVSTLKSLQCHVFFTCSHSHDHWRIQNFIMGADDRGAKGAEGMGSEWIFTWNRWVWCILGLLFMLKRHKKRHTRPIGQVNGGAAAPRPPPLNSPLVMISTLQSRARAM